jgi:hypothetical protein
MKKKDYAIIGMIIIITVLGAAFFNGSKNDNENSHRIAVITQNRKVIEKIDLDLISSARVIELSGNYNETILVEKGRIRFIQADCPDLICVKTGWLEEPGDMAVCLPNRVVVRVEVKR